MASLLYNVELSKLDDFLGTSNKMYNKFISVGQDYDSCMMQKVERIVNEQEESTKIDKIIHNLKVAGLREKTKLEEKEMMYRKHQSNFEGIGCQHDEKLKQCQEDTKNLTELQDEYNFLKEEISQMPEKCKNAICKEEKLISKYNKNLGLRITNTSRRTVCFVFTKIKRSEPDKEYLIELQVKDDKYEILQIIPDIEDKCLIMNHLNETDMFSEFIIYMRKRFVEMSEALEDA